MGGCVVISSLSYICLSCWEVLPVMIWTLFHGFWHPFGPELPFQLYSCLFFLAISSMLDASVVLYSLPPQYCVISICLSVCKSVCLYFFLSVSTSVCVYILIYIPVYLYIHGQTPVSPRGQLGMNHLFDPCLDQ